MDQQLDFINNIVQAEKHAKMISNEAFAQQAALETELAQERDKMKKSLYERAQKRIDMIKQTENKDIFENLTSLDDKINSRMRQVEDVYQQQRDNWIETIFNQVIGR